MLNTVTMYIFVVLSIGSSDHVESVMDEVEKYMMTCLYKEAFCPETTDDEKKDLAIQNRIRSANKSYNNKMKCTMLGVIHFLAFPLSTREHSCI